MADESLESLTADPATAELAELARSLANDPATRKQFLRLVKQKNPNQPIPEIDLESSMQAFAKPHLDKIQAMEERMLKSEAENNILKKRESLFKKGFSEEDVAAIEKMMIEKQIGSHDTAAEFFAAQKKVAEPTPTSFASTMTLPVKGKEVKEAGGIRNWSLQEAFKAAEDIRAGRVKLAS